LIGLSSQELFLSFPRIKKKHGGLKRPKKKNFFFSFDFLVEIEKHKYLVSWYCISKAITQR